MKFFLSFSLLVVALVATIGIVASAPVQASVYDGGGVTAGVDDAAAIKGVGPRSLRRGIANLVNTALTYAALIAVAMVVIAGFYLLFSFGDDGKKDIARKIIFYVGVGLIVILFAKVIVGFFLNIAQ